MTKTLPPRARQSAYTPNDDLSGSLPSSIRMADEFHREELLMEKLGTRGWGRLLYFQRCYSQGWGENGKGQPLSPRSVEALFRFLEALPTSENKPSVFLTDEGNVELGWENSADAAVQVEFTPDGAEYFIERGTEGTVSHSGLAGLAIQLAR